GKLDRGFVQMAEMVNSSRLSNGVKSTALMRRAHHDAMTVARDRVVFGQRIIDLPLARRKLMKIMLTTAQALSSSLLTGYGHGGDAALAADLHARLDDSANVPQAWRSRLRELTDRAIGFAREVASKSDNEGDARRAASLLYHVASAVALAWEGGRIHEMRGDARRLLYSRMVIDHRVSASDPFRLTENATQRAITGHLLAERDIGMAEVGELLVAA